MIRIEHRVLALALMVLGCGDDGDAQGDNKERQTSAIKSYCRNRAKCTDEISESNCNTVTNANFWGAYNKASTECRIAKFEQYVCLGRASCEEYEDACEDHREETDVVCDEWN